MAVFSISSSALEGVPPKSGGALKILPKRSNERPVALFASFFGG